MDRWRKLIGMSMRESPSGSGPSHDAPDPRFLLANERAFLAWNRTALALLIAASVATRLTPSEIRPR